MNINRNFTFQRDDEFGNVGWSPSNMPVANSFEADVVPHDVLEHLATNESCRFVDELIALGASIYVRSENGWYFRSGHIGNSSPSENLGSSLINDILRPALYEGIWRKPKRTAPCDADPEILDSLEVCERLLESEIDVDDHSKFNWEFVRLSMLGWLRTGYRMAQRKYGKHQQYAVMNCWDEIVKQVKLYGDFEGQRITVSVNPATLKVRVVENHEYY